MAGRPLPSQFEQSVRAVFSAVSAVDADHRLVAFIVPVDRPDLAGLAALTAPEAKVHVQLHPAALQGLQRAVRAGFRTGRVLAGPANDDYEPPFHAAGGLNPDAGPGQPCLAEPSGAGKHAALAADAPFRIAYDQPLLVLRHRCFLI